MSMVRGIRQNTYYCGKSIDGKAKYKEIDLFQYCESEIRHTPGRRKKVTCPAQKNFNDKRARRYFTLLVKSNFGKDDTHAMLSYDKDKLPENAEEAEKQMRNFMRRLLRYCKKQNIEAPKYLYITEQSKSGRYHHHMLISGEVARDAIEKIWGQGYIHTDRISVDDKKSLDTLSAYLTKSPEGKSRWHPSRNLIKPEMSSRESAVSQKRFEQLTLWPEDCEDFAAHFEKENPDYVVTEITREYNQVNSTWHISAKLTLKDLRYGRKSKNSHRVSHKKKREESQQLKMFE